MSFIKNKHLVWSINSTKEALEHQNCAADMLTTLTHFNKILHYEDNIWISFLHIQNNSWMYPGPDEGDILVVLFLQLPNHVVKTSERTYKRTRKEDTRQEIKSKSIAVAGRGERDFTRGSR